MSNPTDTERELRGRLEALATYDRPADEEAIVGMFTELRAALRASEDSHESTRLKLHERIAELNADRKALDDDARKAYAMLDTLRAQLATAQTERDEAKRLHGLLDDTVRQLVLKGASVEAALAAAQAEIARLTGPGTSSKPGRTKRSRTTASSTRRAAPRS